MKKLLTLLVAALTAFALVACGGGGDAAGGGGTDEAAAPAANLTDFDWCSFEVPEGYEVESSDYSQVILTATDSNAELHIEYSTTTFETAQTEAERSAGYSDKYTLGDSFEAFGRTWYPVYFDWNDVPSADVYADWNESYFVEIHGFEVTNEDAAYQTVMETLVLNTDYIEAEN